MWSHTLRYYRRAFSSLKTSALDLNFNVTSQCEMEQLGACIGKRLRTNDVILVYGDLGCGKTCLARGSIRKLTNSDILVPSPSYVLVNSYVTPTSILYHVDLYRLQQVTLEDAKALGLVDAFRSGILIIEWPERLFEQTQEKGDEEASKKKHQSWIPKDHLEVIIRYDTQDGNDCRNVALRAAGTSWKDRLIDFCAINENK